MSAEKAPNRTLHIDGLVNARDLGGLRRNNGMLTPHGVFYRSESIDLISPSGWEQLRASGVRTIVDLRQQSERDLDRQERPDWLTTIHSDLDGVENEEFWKLYLSDGLECTSIYYLEHLEAMPERAGDALQALATAPEGAVLFHCKSGRDRTGLIALLLLSAVDVEPEEIVDDYLETVRLGAVRGARLGKENPEPGLEQLLQRHGTSTEGSFRNAVEKLEYSEFLEQAGLSDVAIRALKTWRGSIR